VWICDAANEAEEMDSDEESESNPAPDARRCRVVGAAEPIGRFLRAKAAMLSARLSHRNSVCLSVCHTGGSGKNGPS